MKGTPLIESLQNLHIEPLWERTEGGLRPAPEPEAPQIWRWRDLEPMVDRAVAAVPVEKVDRRVLTLKNPDPRYRMTTTLGTINCGIQILMPEEKAPPHRHSPNALRVSLEGEGGETVVNGVTYKMRRGDIILTPSWTWHAHAHRGTERVVWIDFLDVPLFRSLDQIFFEIAGAGGGGLDPEAPAVGRVHEGPLPVGRFPWAETEAALASAVVSGDGVQEYSVVDPVVGDAAVSTLDCRALRMSGDGFTDARRTSASTVCLVMAGTGESRIGDRTLAWEANDIFTVPHWSWASHRASDGFATMICVSDAPTLERLGMLQENVRPVARQTD